ncbi:MAG: sensor hybrid histidine kinase [Fibrobacteres bacterium]|nr:sensor hybrid histidine kinase [Fibrobacterota bacterium]
MANNRTILLVEDEGPVRRLIARILEMRNYTILEASQGEEALAISETFPGDIHLLVTDIMMPVMNGQELAIRLASLRPRLGVLFISGYPGKHVPEGLESSCKVDYLAKPFKAEVLLDKVTLLMNMAGHGK